VRARDETAEMAETDEEPWPVPRTPDSVKRTLLVARRRNPSLSPAQLPLICGARCHVTPQRSSSAYDGLFDVETPKLKLTSSLEAAETASQPAETAEVFGNPLMAGESNHPHTPTPIPARYTLHTHGSARLPVS
jgi:hypothetical protein